MSIDLNWETITTGPDGDALAAQIRDFIHAKFQAVPLPRFIKSVVVHEFQFGAIPPQLELRDITDPLPDFYEEDPDDDDDEGDDDEDDSGVREENEVVGIGESGRSRAGSHQRHGHGHGQQIQRELQDLTSPFLGVSTPGILGGAASSLHYFGSHLGNGGSQTPLAAVAAHHRGGLRQHENAVVGGSSGDFYPLSSSSSSVPVSASASMESLQESSISIGDQSSRVASTLQTQTQMQTRDRERLSNLTNPTITTTNTTTNDSSAIADDDDHDDEEEEDENNKPRYRDPRPEDVQAVFRIRYAGDVRLNLTAEILLDYPMPSFVNIPVRLSITGLTFDGVGVVAHIRKRVHFCFLSPEDAVAAVGREGGGSNSSSVDDNDNDDGGGGGTKTRFGGLLQEIKVESEIGLRDGGKQSLRNVGKVEKFVLEQVRRIFEDEFVYPSFWTFLV